MRRFLSNQKSFRIVTEQEVVTAFPELEIYVADTPEDYVYLQICEHDPTKDLKFPQLLGPMPPEKAKQTINDYDVRYRESLSGTFNNVVDFQKKHREKE